MPEDTGGMAERVFVSNPNGLKPLMLRLTVGATAVGVVEVVIASPAGADHDPEADAILDCGYGDHASWLYDINGDGKRDSGDTYLCSDIPGCDGYRPFDSRTMNSLVGPESPLTSQQRQVILDESMVHTCPGDGLPDFSEFFATHPWALQYSSWNPAPEPGTTTTSTTETEPVDEEQTPIDQEPETVPEEATPEVTTEDFVPEPGTTTTSTTETEPVDEEQTPIDQEPETVPEEATPEVTTEDFVPEPGTTTTSTTETEPVDEEQTPIDQEPETVPEEATPEVTTEDFVPEPGTTTTSTTETEPVDEEQTPIDQEPETAPEVTTEVGTTEDSTPEPETTTTSTTETGVAIPSKAEVNNNNEFTPDAIIIGLAVAALTGAVVYVVRRYRAKAKRRPSSRR